MADVICPACGSTDLVDETVERTYRPPYGEEVLYRLTIQRCQNCHEGGDFAHRNPPVVRKIIKDADHASVRLMLNSFDKSRDSVPDIERVFGLENQTLARWNAGDISAEGLALLRVIRTYPWILTVAAEGFDRDFANAALQIAAVTTEVFRTGQ